MGVRDAAVGALRPSGSAGSTVAGGRAGPGLTAVLEAVWQGVVELGHGAVQAVQRDGWQQQQRGSGGGGGEEQEKQRSGATRDGRPLKCARTSPPQRAAIKRGR
jgi:hypothetical protein